MQIHPRKSKLLLLVAWTTGSLSLLGSLSAVHAQPNMENTRNTGVWNLEAKSRLAISGYDPVAYFPEGGGKPALGNPSITAELKGARYQFATPANREKFLANSSRYEPAHGGWCSWAMREGSKVEVDPKSFILRDNRLFLFYNGWLGDTRSKWLAGDHTSEAREADAHWRKLSGEAPRMSSAAVVSGALKSKLDPMVGRGPQADPHRDEAMQKRTAIVAETGVVETALKLGATAPDFELPDADGKPVKLAALRAKGPVILTWYRGVWCPFCNLQLHAYQQSLSEFQSLGATLVAISSQLPDSSRQTAEKSDLQFPVLSDVGSKVGRQYGLIYTLPDGMRTDLHKYNGEGSRELPLAATYVVDASGKIVYAMVTADYSQRAEPADIIEALKKLQPVK